MKKVIVAFVLLSVVFGSAALAQSKKPLRNILPTDTATISTKPLVTFIELGSVNCIPCKAMQPVMKSVETKYGSQINVVFYDVWKKEQAHFAEQYGIRLIPTQVFLDASGKELMRHEGFLPEKEIDAFLHSRSLRQKTTERD